MAPTRSARYRLISILFNAFLCFVIVMQILGATTSFWTLGFDADLLGASVLEGLSLIPTHVTLSTLIHAEPYHEALTRLPSFLLEDLLFRPPDVVIPLSFL
jgi:hypothetical protein